MEFFNRKEEVIDIQLTQYGKYLLSRGKFSPKFYAFYDGDLLYDSNYAGFSENQNNASNRIKETSRIKGLHVFEGAETRIKKVTQGENLKNLDIDEKAKLLEQYQPSQTKFYGLTGQLGTSDLATSTAPAWSISFLEGDMEGSSANYAGSIKNELIPQIDITLETKIDAVAFDNLNLDLNDNAGDSDLDDALDDESIQMFAEFNDNSSFKIKSDTAIISIREINAPLRNVNFDIEVFEIEKDENDLEQLKPLKFTNDESIGLKTNLAVQVTNQAVGSTGVKKSENKMFANYYIDLNFDGQIESPAQSTPMVVETLAPSELTNVPINDFVCPEEINVFEQSDIIGGNGDSSTGSSYGESGTSGGSGGTGGSGGGSGGSGGGGGGY